MIIQAKNLKDKLKDIKKNYNIEKWQKIEVKTKREYDKGKFVGHGEAIAYIHHSIVEETEINQWYEYIRASGLRTYWTKSSNGLNELGIIKEY